MCVLFWADTWLQVGEVVGNRPCSKGAKLQKAQATMHSATSSNLTVLTRTGGYLVYSTCSLNTKLNEGVIEALLHAEPSACLVPSFPNLPFEQITIRGVSSRCGVWNKIGSNEPKETWCHRLSPSASQWSQRWQRRQETN